jgi:hypothetical protein
MNTKECKRCGQEASVSAIGEALFNFVCDICRLDSGAFHFGRDITIKAMEYQMVSHGPYHEKSI